jgi:ABC-2 type transport system ATP-binding protein
MSKENAKKASEKALHTVELWDLRKRRCAEISGGEKRRAIIASALASDADVLLLDEPTSGLDAVAKRSVWSALRDLKMEDKTILLTTHNMEEAEMVSDRLGIINRGQIVAEGSPEEIKKSMKERYRVILHGDLVKVTEGDIDCVKIGDRHLIYVHNEDEAIQIMKEALKKGVQASVSQTTLEDAFVKLVGESL